MMTDTDKIFLEQSARYMTMSLDRITLCLDKLDTSQIWFKPNQNTNSIGNLVLHLCGNICQYILSGLGEVEDKRDRESEFSLGSRVSKEELVSNIKSTIEASCETILSVENQLLFKEFKLQGFTMTGLEAILHVTEHLSYHTGQIALLTKLARDEDLGFYKGLDLNKKNK